MVTCCCSPPWLPVTSPRKNGVVALKKVILKWEVCRLSEAWGSLPHKCLEVQWTVVDVPEVLEDFLEHFRKSQPWSQFYSQVSHPKYPKVSGVGFGLWFKVQDYVLGYDLGFKFSDQGHKVWTYSWLLSGTFWNAPGNPLNLTDMWDMGYTYILDLLLCPWYGQDLSLFVAVLFPVVLFNCFWCLINLIH